MANPIHLRILMQGIDVWNRWRHNYPDVMPNLSKATLHFILFGVNFSRVNFTGANLEGANLEEANLSEADFSKANLQRTHLFAANISKANFIEANLEGANLEEANLSEADFSKANLQRTRLFAANISKANFIEANLEGANLEEANLSEADFSKANLQRTRLFAANLHKTNLCKSDFYDADLRGAKLTKANLRGADLRLTNLDGTDLSEADLSKANLRETSLCAVNLSRANFSGANLSRANFSGANLSETALGEANLHGINFRGANLFGADLKETDLSGTDLSKANLRRANIKNAVLVKTNLCMADLQHANLRGADLSGANLSNANLCGANLYGTILCGEEPTEMANITKAVLTEINLTPEGKPIDGGSFLDLSMCLGLETARFSEPDFLPNYLTKAFEYAHNKNTYEARKWPDFIERAIKNIKVLQSLYIDQQSPKQLIEMVSIITNELIMYLKKHPKALYQIKPRQFEELIAEILASYKWQVQLTPATKDGGYDIFAISRDLSNVQTSWIIECKKYSSENKVGVDIVRALYGIKSNLKVANALLATTSYFTKGAKDFKTSRYDVELKDYEAILEWINQYRPNPDGKLYIKNNRLIVPNKSQ